MSRSSREQRAREFRENYEKQSDLIIIPPKKEYNTDFNIREELVGPYCRVSTMADTQVESYELQKLQYEEMVNLRPNWCLVDIYADEGISATSMKRRKNLLRLIEDCKAGKVTLIVTKSVTRFARNTVDCVSTCRMLKSLTRRRSRPCNVTMRNCGAPSPPCWKSCPRWWSFRLSGGEPCAAPRFSRLLDILSRGGESLFPAGLLDILSRGEN